MMRQTASNRVSLRFRILIGTKTTAESPSIERTACGLLSPLIRLYCSRVGPAPTPALRLRHSVQGCGETIPAPVETMPDSWIVADCPLCGTRRRYLPTEIFRGALSHKFLGGQHHVVVR